MAFSLEQLEALKCALAEGALIVKYQDKMVEYRSFDEMKKIIDLIEGELGIKKSRCVKKYASFTKGTC